MVGASIELRRLVGGFAALSVGYTIAKGIGFLAITALARSMPAEQLGAYATVITLVGYLQAVTNWGSDALGIRFAAQSPETSGTLYRAVLRSRFAVGIAPLVVLLLGLVWHNASASCLLAVAAAWLAFLFRADWLLLAQGRSRAVGILVGVRETAFALLAVTIVRSIGTAESALWSYAVAEWAWSIGTRRMVAQVVHSGGRPSCLGTLQLIRQGLPLALVSLTVLTSNKIDVPILAKYRTAGEVAAYWAAYNIMFAAMLLSAMWDRVALATMSRQAAKGQDCARGASLHYSILGGVLGTVMALALHGFAWPILRVAYAGRFEEAAAALSILALALPAIYLSGVLAARLVAESRQQGWTVAAAIGAVVNVGVNLALIPRVGMLGAGIATLVSEWVLFLVIASHFREAKEFGAFAANVGYLVAGGCLSLALVLGIGKVGTPWATLAAIGGFLIYAVPIITQRVPTRLQLRHPLGGREA